MFPETFTTMFAGTGRILTTLCVAGASVAASACTSDPAAESRAYLASGDRYVNERKLNEALVEYRNAVLRNPQSGEARLKLADTYMRVDDTSNALRAYIRAADLLPNDTGAQLHGVTALLLAQRYEEAADRARMLVRKEPGNGEAQMALGYALAGLNDLDGAVDQIEEALKLAPAQSSALSNLGTLQLARRDIAAAERAFRQAVELSSGAPEPYLALATFFWSTGRPADAEAALRTALEKAPEHPGANRALGIFLVLTGNTEEAERYVSKFATLSGTVESTIALADYYQRADRPADARRVLDARLTVTDKNTDAPADIAALRVRLAALWAEAGDRSTANRLLGEVLQGEGPSADALVLKARLQLADGRTDEAKETIASAITRTPNSTSAHFGAGQVYAGLQDWDAAKREFTEARRLNPRAPGPAVELARMHLLSGDGRQAVQYASDAVTSAPTSLDARLMLVRTLLAQPDVERAEFEARRLEQALPEHSDVLTQVGLVHLAKGRLPEAERTLSKAFEMSGDIEALTGLVAVDLAKRDVVRARQRVSARLASSPADVSILMLSADLAVAEGNLTLAEETFRRVVTLDPSQLRAYGRLGQVLLHQSRLAEAQQEFEAWAKLQPTSMAAQTLAAMTEDAQGHLAAARARYERIVQIDPQAAAAANNLAWIYAQEGGNLDMALQLAQTAKAKLPDAPEVIDTLGWILMKKGLHTQAVSMLRESVSREPGNPTYRYHLGLAYAGAGQREGARRELTAAIARGNFEGLDAARSALAALAP